MKTKLIAIIIGVGFVSGCASQSKTAQYAGDAVAIGAGAAIAHELSDGNPVTTVAGGIGALGIKSVADSVAGKKRDQEIRTAFNQGLAQGLKYNYFTHQSQQAMPVQNQTDQGSGVKLPINAPERVINGVIINPTTEYITVDSPSGGQQK